MALSIVHHNSGQQAFRCVVTYLNVVAGDGESDVWKAADYLNHVWHVLRGGSATGTIKLQASLTGDANTWIDVETIDLSQGSAEIVIESRSYPFIKFTHATVANGTVTVRGHHIGGV